MRTYPMGSAILGSSPLRGLSSRVSSCLVSPFPIQLLPTRFYSRAEIRLFPRNICPENSVWEAEGNLGQCECLSVPALQIDADIPPQGNVQVEVTFPPSGMVHFGCKFHTAMGMNDALLAGDAAPQVVAQGAMLKANTGGAY